MNQPVKHLYRSQINRKIAGICGGLGIYLNVDPTIMRLLYIFITLFSVGLGIIAYLIMWVIIPEEPPRSGSSTVNHEDNPPQQ